MPEADYVVMVARTLGEDPKDVQDVLDAIKVTAEEERWEDEGGA
jgi:hypothetical protein